MKLKLFLGALNAAALFSASVMMGQNFQTMPVQSGYTADVIANGVGSASASTTMDVDGVSYAFVAKDFQLTSTSTPITYGLPANGIINSVVAGTPGLSYVLGNLSGNNSLRLAATGDSGTLAFTTPKAAFTLYMLSTSGSGVSTVSVTVNFTDGTSQAFSNISLSDWYGGANFAIQGIGRIKISTNALEASSTDPRLYQTPLAIDPANHAKPIQSVTVTKTSAGGSVPNIFAFSADAYSDCMPPTLQPVTAITQNSAQLSWTAPANSQVVNYDVYYSTSNTAPTGSTPATIPGVSGTSVSTGNGLASNTTYYYWVRTNCSTATSQSVWSFSGTFKTACGPMTSMFENFDSYATGNIVPDCWTRLVTTTGSMSISSATPASGTRHIYQYSTTTQNPTVVVLPEFSNINAGTHWLRFKARVSTATGTLNVGYVTDPTDAATFVQLEALSIANTVYTTANSEYVVTIPSSVPANARLAIKNTADGKSYYWDDVYWESIPSCVRPNNLSVQNILANSANVSWSPSITSGILGYEIYHSTNSTAPTAATTPTITNISATNQTISGLTASSLYYVWVRTRCTASDASEWSPVITFNTLCGAVVPAYVNDFSTIPGNCWANALSGGTPATGPTGTSAYWLVDGFLNSGTTGAIRINLYSVNRTGWLKSTMFDLSAGGYRVKFDYGVTTYSGTVASAMGSDDIVQFLMSEDGGTTWTVIDTWDAGHAPSNTSTTYVYNIPGVSPTTVFALYGSDGTVDDTQDYNFYIDNFTVEAVPLSTSEVKNNKKEIKVHPNPFKDVLYISDMKDVKSVAIRDVSGRVVKTIDNPTKELHLGELNAGLYLVTIQFKDGSVSTVKTIKQ